jgi:hypothetical protein
MRSIYVKNRVDPFLQLRRGIGPRPSLLLPSRKSVKEKKGLNLPEWSLLNFLVGATGFEPATPCSEDGLTIDLSPVAIAGHGFIYPMAVTERVWVEVVISPREVATWQDDLGRLNDLLKCLRHGIKKSPNTSTEINFQMEVMNNDREPSKTITLKHACGPGDNREAAITMVFPDEDSE